MSGCVVKKPQLGAAEQWGENADKSAHKTCHFASYGTALRKGQLAK